MSARKLSRLAGLVLVLAAAFGGASAGHVVSDSTAAVRYSTLEFDWGAKLSALEFDWR